jgi:hypothetical protein
MPIAMMQMIPGGTEEDYERLGEKIFGVRSDAFSVTDAPDGLILHTAGPTDDGWFVYDVWETAEHMQAFANERVVPAQEELGAPNTGPPKVFQIHKLVLAGRTAAS